MSLQERWNNLNNIIVIEHYLLLFIQRLIVRTTYSEAKN